MCNKNNFLAAIEGNDHEKVPVWFMRQAGRYLPKYHELRKNRSIMEITLDPNTVEEISYLPVNEIGVDASIIFSDILLPVETMGFKLHYEDGKGPMISNSVLSGQNSKIMDYEPAADPYLPVEAVRLFKSRHPSTPLIGFCGGPVTVASYLIKGESDGDLAATRSLMYRKPDVYRRILRHVTDAMILLLKSQISAGCDVVQIFDSWAGSMSRDQFQQYRENFLSDIFTELGSSRSIYFSTSSWHLVDQLKELGATFLSMDWRSDLSSLIGVVRSGTGLQGNLDPVLSQSGSQACETETRRIVDSMLDQDGYIFNLGHGVLPGTDPGTLRDIVNIVHSYSR
jgi:uroporphyrinogen decarboxylase